MSNKEVLLVILESMEDLSFIVEVTVKLTANNYNKDRSNLVFFGFFSNVLINSIV